MKSLILPLCLCLCAPCWADFAKTLDACEQYLDDTPLCDDASWVATRFIADNRTSLADVADVYFVQHYTADESPWLSWFGTDDPENPWRLAKTAPNPQFFRDKWWNVALSVTFGGGIERWGPAWVEVDPADPINGPEVLLNIVPAGACWDLIAKLNGENIRLFHSPASGELDYNGLTETLYDSDPRPQTVPEPTVLLLLLLTTPLLRSRR